MAVGWFIPERSKRRRMSAKSNGSRHWGHSLRRLSWDESLDKTLSQKLISSTIHEWYDAKHRISSIEEIKLINSIRIDHCPLYKSNSFIRNGCYKRDLRRYRCSCCNHYFNTLTNTIFDVKKIPISEWIEYLLHLFEFHSITTSARDNRNAYSTGKYWLIKVFSILKHYQDDIILEGNIYCDETFFACIQSDRKLKPDGKQYRGISRNKFAVASAYDDRGHVILICENVSKPSLRSTWNALGSYIKEGSTLIHDGERSHSVLIDKLKLESIVYDADQLKKLPDKDNPLDSINEIHSLAKLFMRQHGGYNRDDLQDWMNLISFILNDPKDRYEKVDKFINMALSSPIRVRYRDVMLKKRRK